DGHLAVGGLAQSVPCQDQKGGDLISMNDPHRPTCAIFFDERSSIAARRQDRRTSAVRQADRPFAIGYCRQRKYAVAMRCFVRSRWVPVGSTFLVRIPDHRGYVPASRVERCG